MIKLRPGLTFLVQIVDLRICDLINCRHKARPCLTICGLTCVGVARHQPMVADRRLETAAAAALDTMVLNRRLVRSRGDSERVGDERPEWSKKWDVITEDDFNINLDMSKIYKYVLIEILKYVSSFSYLIYLVISQNE